nr:LpqN/LpqT family lipoprotein [Pseudonocardia sp. AL041005-10]
MAEEAELPFVFVEGNAELTPARLVGHFDPAQVLERGYNPRPSSTARWPRRCAPGPCSTSRRSTGSRRRPSTSSSP